MLPKRIVLIRLRSLGDLVLMTPALEVLGRQPNVSVAVVAETSFDQLFTHHPAVDQVLTIGRKASWPEKFRLGRQIRAFKPDAVVDLHGGSTSALLTAFSGAAHRVGYESSRYHRFYNRRIPDTRTVWGKPKLHTVEHQLAPLKYLGFPVPRVPKPRIYFSDSDRVRVRTELQQLKVDPGFVLIHPAAAFTTKQWPTQSFAALARHLARDRQVVVTAGPGEESLCVEVAGSSGPNPCIIRPQPLGRFSALVSFCGLYVGNDTGSTHIAAALEKPVVAVFGSSDSEVWHPWATEYRLVRSDLPCIPCPGYRCLHYDSPRCIESIPLEDVLSACRKLFLSSCS